MITQMTSGGVAQVAKKIDTARAEVNGQWVDKPCKRAELLFAGQTVYLDFEHHAEVFGNLRPGVFVRVETMASHAVYDGRLKSKYELLRAEVVSGEGTTARRAAA